MVTINTRVNRRRVYSPRATIFFDDISTGPVAVETVLFISYNSI